MRKKARSGGYPAETMRLQVICLLFLSDTVLVSSYPVLIRWRLPVYEGCKGITEKKKD